MAFWGRNIPAGAVIVAVKFAEGKKKKGPSLTRVTKSYLLVLGNDYPDKLLYHQALN